MLLGFIVSERGIEANPKISAITRMGPIQNIKGYNELQGVSPRLAALSDASANELGLPLYRLLKKANRFEWILKTQEALDKVKQLLTKAPILDRFYSALNPRSNSNRVVNLHYSIRSSVGLASPDQARPARRGNLEYTFC
jgi:hypothetical protein